MAQRGRKPKPTAVKVLEGNPGKRGAECGGAEAGEEGSQVSGVAGSGGEEGMEADGEADGTAWYPDGD